MSLLIIFFFKPNLLLNTFNFSIDTSISIEYPFLKQHKTAWIKVIAEENIVEIFSRYYGCQGPLQTGHLIFDKNFNRIFSTSGLIGGFGNFRLTKFSSTPSESYYILFYSPINYDCEENHSIRNTITYSPKVTKGISPNRDFFTCIGDTVRFEVGFSFADSIIWKVPSYASIVEQNNNEILIQFDSIGRKDSISAEAFGSCGTTIVRKELVVGTYKKIKLCPFQLPFNLNGFEMLDYGEYPFTFQSTRGCDSTIIYSVEKNYGVRHIHEKICSGQTFEFDTIKVNSTSLFNVYQNSRNSFECDSVFSIYVEVVDSIHEPNVVEYKNVVICEGDSIAFGGKYYSSPGIYYEYFPNVINDFCDSTFKLRLTTIDPNKPINFVCEKFVNPPRVRFKWNRLASIHSYTIFINGEEIRDTQLNEYSYFPDKSLEEINLEIQPISESDNLCSYPSANVKCVGPELTSSTSEIINNNFSIIPNPSNGIFKIKGKLPIDEILIFDYNGKLIKKSLEKTIDFENQPVGIYFLKIQTGGTVIMKKFMKS